MFNEENHPLKEVPVKEPVTGTGTMSVGDALAAGIEVQIAPEVPATPETVLAKQAALNTRIANLKKWILQNVHNSKKRAEGIADLEQAHAELAKGIMEELG